LYRPSLSVTWAAAAFVACAPTRGWAQGATGAEFQVNSYTTGDQEGGFVGAPQVARSQDGRFVVAWGSGGQDGSGYGVFAQRHDDVIFQDGFES
jgi:hypothetical protein